MSVKNSTQYKELVQALEVLEELKIPEALQNTALNHLLGVSSNAPTSFKPMLPLLIPSNSPSTTQGLRTFMGSIKSKGAVTEIPCLMYWAKINETKEDVDEKGIIELYRRAGIKPPKNVSQSLRDLASKKYGRLEAVNGQAGYVRLSRVGEDFVLHDAIQKD